MEHFEEDRWEGLRQRIAIASVFVLFGLGIAVTAAERRFDAAFGKDAIGMAPYPQLSFVLMVATGLLIVLWLLATTGELRMLRHYAREFIPPLPDFTVQILIFIIVLGSLAYFSNNLVIYSGIFAGFKLVEIWLLWIRDLKLKTAFDNARERSDLDDRRRSLSVVDRPAQFSVNVRLGVQ